jgi:hypothetical protein
MQSTAEARVRSQTSRCPNCGGWLAVFSPRNSVSSVSTGPIPLMLILIFHFYTTLAFGNVTKYSNFLSVCVKSLSYGLDETQFRSRQWQDIIFSETSRPALASTQPRIQWLQEFFTGGEAAGGIKLNTSLHLIPRIRMSWSIPLLPPYIQGQLLSVWTIRSVESVV